MCVSFSVSSWASMFSVVPTICFGFQVGSSSGIKNKQHATCSGCPLVLLSSVSVRIWWASCHQKIPASESRSSKTYLRNATKTLQEGKHQSQFWNMTSSSLPQFVIIILIGLIVINCLMSSFTASFYRDNCAQIAASFSLDDLLILILFVFFNSSRKIITLL